PPTLGSPADGATAVPTTPTLSWSGVSGANTYWLTVATSDGALPTDPNASSCSCVVSKNVSGTSYTLPSALNSGTTYYWEVQGFVLNGNTPGQQGQFSAHRSFTTANSLLPPPSLNSPGNGESGVSTTPTFSWSAVSGANTYWLTVATSDGALPSDVNASSCSCVVSKNVSGTSYT